MMVYLFLFYFNSHFLFQLLGIAFQFNAIDLIMHYINLKENKDVRLAFEALKVRNFFYQIDSKIKKK